MCKNLQIFKNWLNFVKRSAGQAKHVFRVPEEAVPTGAGLHSSNLSHQTRIRSSTQEPRRCQLLVLLRKLETHTKCVEKLNTRNSGEI